MPFVSKAQQGYMEANKGGRVPASVVEEFEKATPKSAYKRLPRHIGHLVRSKRKRTLADFLGGQ